MSEEAAAYIDSQFRVFLKTLSGFARIPSISGAPENAADLRRSAEAVRVAMAAAGLEKTEVLDYPGAHPYVYGEHLHALGRPTLLAYAHHDVQSPGRASHWRTPPFEPTMRPDGRLYARGIVDNKAGVVTYLAAIEAWLKTVGTLPVNIKMIVDGEEEIGSPHLGEFLRKHKDKLWSDLIVVIDTANLDIGIPSLTYRLRGTAFIEFEVTGLEYPLHSGMWGGPVPDPVQAMAKILATLTDEEGRIAIPGIYDEVALPTPTERAAIQKLPFDAAKFRSDGGMRSGLVLGGEKGYSVYEQLWLRPAITVIALEASPIKGSSTQIIPSARARISLRLVPHMDPTRSMEKIIAHIERVAPWGVTLNIKSEGGVPAWACNPEGPAFDAAKRALAIGFGCDVAVIGTGGSIPFVGSFAKALCTPILLIGLADPICNAHAENESLNVEDWRRTLKAVVYLYDELSRL